MTDAATVSSPLEIPRHSIYGAPMNRHHDFSLRVIFALLVVPVALPAQTTYERECAALAARSGADSERLNQLFELDWKHTMEDHPEFATSVGYPGQNNRWTDLSLAAIERRKKETAAPLKVIRSIDRSRLSPPEQLNYDLFRFNAQRAAEGKSRSPAREVQVTAKPA